MAKVRLKRLKLGDDISEKLSANSINTIKDLLSLNPLELMKILQKSYQKVNEIILKVSKACAPQPVTLKENCNEIENINEQEEKLKRLLLIMSDLKFNQLLREHFGCNMTAVFPYYLSVDELNIHKHLQTTLPGISVKIFKLNEESRQFLKFGFPKLDLILKGGIPSGSLTEVAGPPGCGKTQFCIMMSVQAVLPTKMGGLDGSVFYIDTESAFSAKRLIEIAQSKYQSEFSDHRALEKLADRVHIQRATTCAALSDILDKLEVEIIVKKIKFVVLDSIASLVHKEFNISESAGRMERTSILIKLATRLKYLAESFHIPIVVTNQITTRFSQEGVLLCRNPSSVHLDEGSASLENNSGYTTAALGNTWSHCVNTRIAIQFQDDHVRELIIAKSPIAPFVGFPFTIQSKGLVLHDEEGFNFPGTDPGLLKIRPRRSIVSDIT